jgi:uncharacterized repeat protein (TIGR02543 family)
MNRLIHYLLSVLLSYSVITHAENYTLQHEEIFNDAEAQQVIRYGDIDNLGFGWPEGFNPFSGESTRWHGYPWTANSEDADGTDRIMVISSYIGSAPFGQDGYVSNTSRPDNTPHEIAISFTPPVPALTSAILQVFVDDFQAPLWQARYQVTMNGIRVPDLEVILNSLEQTGPIGKLITFQIPDDIIATMNTNQLKIFIDDPETGAGDGFAFDFFRLLINPRNLQNTGVITGFVFDAETRQPLENAVVATSTNQVKTNAAGYYELQQIPAGLVNLRTDTLGYQLETANLDLVTDTTVTHDFYLRPIATYAFIVKVNGNGVVASSDGTINCSSECSSNFDSDTLVTLKATPKTGSVFNGWNGACANKTGDCVVTITAATSVTANFNPLPSYKLSITKIGNGAVTSKPAGINCGTACSKQFTSGTAVTLTAKPNTGGTFSKWTGCTPLATNPLQCTVTLTSNKTVTAAFNNGALGDLKITAIALTPASPAANSIFTAAITVKNQGTVTANGGYLDVWAHQTAVQTCGAQAEWIEIGSLAAGASKTLTVSLRSKGTGSKTLRAFVDSWCVMPESDETNNQFTKTYTVK